LLFHSNENRKKWLFSRDNLDIFATLKIKKKKMIRAAIASQQPTRFATLINVRHALFTHSNNDVSEQLFCVNDFVLYLAHCQQTPRQLLAPWLSKKRTSDDAVGVVFSVSAKALIGGQDVPLFEEDGVTLLPQHAKAQTFYASSNVLLSLLFMHSRPDTVLHRLVTQQLVTLAAFQTQLSVSGDDLTALECEKTTYRSVKRSATDTNNEQDRSKQVIMRGKMSFFVLKRIFYFLSFYYCYNLS
jgi:hypothetical protein